MSRIRSIHPGLWTDDAFMSLSAFARLLCIGLWNEAFDDGVFEWKPLTIKARIFPADHVDVLALLDELVKAGFIMEETAANEKHVGLIRNFREYQRPKTPNSSGLMRDEWRSYVGLSVVDTEPLENHSGNGSEKVPQMEDGGDKVKEEDKTSPPVLVTEARALFDRVWEAFPRNPQSSETEAEAAFNATKAKDRPAILAAALRFRQWFVEDNVARDRTEDAGARYVKPLASWITSGKWRDAENLPLKAGFGEVDPDLAVIDVGSDDFKAISRLRGHSPFVGDSGRITVRKSELEQARLALTRNEAA